MDNASYISFLALHSHPIVEQLSQMQGITEKNALDVYFNSHFYKLFERENTKLWHFSNVTLAGLLNQELTTGHIEFPVEG